MRRLIAILLVAWTCAGAAWADEAGAAAELERLRRNEPALTAFLLAMPKGADLHSHYTGAVYAEYILDNAVRQKKFFDPVSGRFEAADGPGRVPAEKAARDPKLLAQFLDRASMRGTTPGETGHDHFFDAFGIFDDAIREMVPDEALLADVRDAAEQRIAYLELMASVAPEAAYEAAEGDPPDVADMDKALATLRPRLEAFARATRSELDRRDRELAQRLGWKAPLSDPRSPVMVRYIVSANRNSADRSIFTRWAMGMAAMQADPRVVGVNLVAPEDFPTSRLHFERQMQMLDFLWKRFGKPNISLHAGELTLQYSPLLPMRSRIRRSVEVGHARRIGHGVSVPFEADVDGLLAEMRRDGVAVEICLTSNDGILGVRGERHPFHLYRRAGVPMTLNTDDAGVDRTTLTSEFVRAVRELDLTYAEVKTLVRNSLEYSFLPGDSMFLERDYRRPRPELAGGTDSEAAQRFLASSVKAQAQARLERDLADFERRFPH